MKPTNHRAVVCLLFALSACLGPSTSDLPTISLASDQAAGGVLTVTLEPNGPSVTRTIIINNHGTCVLSFATGVEDAWLSATPASGTIAANGAAPVTLTVASHDNTGALAPGKYLGTLDITATCPATGQAVVGSPAAVAITVVVAPADAGTAMADGGMLDSGVR